jgi:integrase
MACGHGGRDPARRLGGPGGRLDHARRVRQALGGRAGSQGTHPGGVRTAPPSPPAPVPRQPDALVHHERESQDVAYGPARWWRRPVHRCQDVPHPACDLRDGGRRRPRTTQPCRVKGAGSDQTDETPTATLDQVFAIARAIQPRYRLLVLLATFAQLRFGELVALRRSSVDTDAMELRVTKATAEMEDGTQVDGDPKSRAGKRPISLPAALKKDIGWHLDHIAQPGPMGRLFIGPQGGIPRRRNFNRVWRAAVKKAGIPADVDLHLHDLRHTGSTWSAQSGATLKELMARIGHSSTRAAMVYQHATRERDQAIAKALDALIDEARKATESDDDGS